MKIFKNSLTLFFFIFGISYWQRKRLANFYQKIDNRKVRFALYVLTGWIWATFLEYYSGRLLFNPKPIVNLIIGSGFYLPYFAISLRFTNRYQFNFLEIFCLSGLGKLFFDLFISRKLLTPTTTTTNALGAFLIFFIQVIFTFLLFGALTTLPTFYLRGQKKEHYDRPIKEYLLGMTPIFCATAAFIVWIIILKIIFRA